MMKHAFELGYRRYEWKCNALNLPSRVAAQRLGLSFERVFRQAAAVKGRNRDTAWYSALDTEWAALKGAFEAWLAPANFDERGIQRLQLSALTGPLLQQRGWDHASWQIHLVDAAGNVASRTPVNSAIEIIALQRQPRMSAGF